MSRAAWIALPASSSCALCHPKQTIAQMLRYVTHVTLYDIGTDLLEKRRVDLLDRAGVARRERSVFRDNISKWLDVGAVA